MLDSDWLKLYRILPTNVQFSLVVNLCLLNVCYSLQLYISPGHTDTPNEAYHMATNLKICAKRSASAYIFFSDSLMLMLLFTSCYEDANFLHSFSYFPYVISSFLLLIRQVNAPCACWVNMFRTITFILLVFPTGLMHGVKAVKGATQSISFAAVFKILLKL